MDETQREQLRQAFRDHPDLLDGDGWSIFGPEHYTERGVPADFLKPLHVSHRSGKGKYAIARSDGTVGDTSGIYNLNFLSRAAAALGATDYPSKMGRGYQAREICAAIRRVL